MTVKNAVYKRLYIAVYKRGEIRNCLTLSVQTENVHTRKCSIRKVKILKVATNFFDPKNR